MEPVIHFVATLRAYPLLGVGLGAAVIVAALLLMRKPKIQRDADARLAALRRDKPDPYGKLRPPH